MKEIEMYNNIVYHLECIIGIEVLQNEVEFRNQIKSVDMLGVKDDEFYIIEIKRNCSPRNRVLEDYSNLRYIIDNNAIGKKLNGILISNTKDIEIISIAERDKDIEIISLEDNYFLQKLSTNKNLIKHKSEYLNDEYKYFRKVFLHTNNTWITNFYYYENSFTEEYKMRGKEYFSFKKNPKSPYGEVYVKKHEVEKNNLYIEVKSVYKTVNDIICYEAIYNDKERLQKYISIQDVIKIEHCYKLRSLLNRKDIFLNINNDKKHYIMLDPCYIGFYENKQIKEIDIKKTIALNKVNYIECTNIVIDKKIYKPIMKKDIISVNSSKIILSVTLKKKNKTKNNKFEFNLNIDDPKKNDIDLFLFLNFRMICEFEESILKDIECGWHIDDCHRKYELEMVSKKYKESKYYIETVRDIIFNLTGKIRYYQKSKKSRN